MGKVDDQVAEARQALHEALSNHAGPHYVVADFEAAIEARAIERYLAGCAAPGCGHKQPDHREGVPNEDGTARLWEGCGLCIARAPDAASWHAYISRSELLARAAGNPATIINIRLTRRAEAAEARNAMGEAIGLLTNEYRRGRMPPALEQRALDAVAAFEAAVEARAIERYLAGCAAPGCGHEEQAHEWTDAQEQRMCGLCAQSAAAQDTWGHAYLPRSELLARAAGNPATIINIRLTRRAEAAEARVAELTRLAYENQERGIRAEARAQVYREAVRDLVRSLPMCGESEAECPLCRARAALTPVVEGGHAS